MTHVFKKNVRSRTARNAVCFVRKVHRQRLCVARRFRSTATIRWIMCGLATRMERATVAPPSLKAKLVAKRPVKRGIMAPAGKAVTPTRNTNAQTARIPGVAITGNLAEQQKDNVLIVIIQIRRPVKRLAKPAVGSGR